MDKSERSILLVTCYGHFMSHFNMLVFPAVLLPLSLHLHLSMVETLTLSLWMYLLFGLTALPWGIAADKFGSRKLLAIFHIGAGMSCIGAAMVTDSPFHFSVALAGIGFFSGIYHPVGLGWIATDVKNTSRAMAYNGMFGNLGLATAPVFAGLLNHFYGIEVVYLLTGVVNCTGLLLIFCMGTRTRQCSAPTHTSKPPPTSYTPFFILLPAMMLGGIVYRGTSVSLPAYFELKNGDFLVSLAHFLSGIGTENVGATLVTSLIYLVGILGQFIGGKVGEKYDLRRGYLLFHLITVPASIGMAITANIPLIVCATIHSFFLLGMQPIENTLVSRLAPPNLMSSAYGLKFILTFGVGAISVKLIEAVKASFGTSAIYLALAMVSGILVCVIILLIFKTTTSKQIKPQRSG